MKKNLLPSLLLTFSLVIASGQTFAQNTLLYKVQKKKKSKPSYVYGTIHISDKRAFDFKESVMPAFESCPQFAMEVVMDPADMLGMMSKMMMKDKTLKDIFTAEEYGKLEQYFLDSLDQPLALFNNFKPFFVATMMMKPNFNSEMSLPLDLYFMEKAKDQDKNVVGLETLEEQLSVIDRMDMDAQKKMVLDMMEPEASDPDYMDRMMRFYTGGMLDSLAAFVQEADMGPEFEKDFLITRNHNMVDRMIPLMKKKPVFVAVGAAHLPGEEGILTLLEKEGYIVTPVY